MNELYDSYEKSVKILSEILGQPRSIISRDAAIKRFELTFEIAWKCLQFFFEQEGFICRSPRECFKYAFYYELTGDDSSWMDMIKDRNNSIHAYEEKVLDSVFEKLPEYLLLLEEIFSNISKDNVDNKVVM